MHFYHYNNVNNVKFQLMCTSATSSWMFFLKRHFFPTIDSTKYWSVKIIDNVKYILFLSKSLQLSKQSEIVQQTQTIICFSFGC